MSGERRIGNEEMHNDIKEIKEILVGKEGKNGLVAKVNSHDRYIGSQMKFAWLVLSSGVIALGSIITSLFTIHKNN